MLNSLIHKKPCCVVLLMNLASESINFTKCTFYLAECLKNLPFESATIAAKLSISLIKMWLDQS